MSVVHLPNTHSTRGQLVKSQAAGPFSLPVIGLGMGSCHSIVQWNVSKSPLWGFWKSSPQSPPRPPRQKWVPLPPLHACDSTAAATLLQAQGAANTWRAGPGESAWGGAAARAAPPLLQSTPALGFMLCEIIHCLTVGDILSRGFLLFSPKRNIIWNQDLKIKM